MIRRVEGGAVVELVGGAVTSPYYCDLKRIRELLFCCFLLPVIGFHFYLLGGVQAIMYNSGERSEVGVVPVGE